MMRFAKSTKLAALALAGATILASAGTADAGWRGRGHGWGGPGWGPGYYYGPRYRNNNGAAIAAGVIGGLALGAIAAQAYNQPRCWMQTQVFYNRWGQPYYRDVRVCN